MTSHALNNNIQAILVLRNLQMSRNDYSNLAPHFCTRTVTETTPIRPNTSSQVVWVTACNY